MPLPKYICFIIISTFIFSTAQAQDNLAVYEIIDTIEFSKYPLLGPGSISRNGKSFYFSAEVNLVDYLCVIKRDNTKSNFGKIIFLEDEKGFKIEGSQATVSKKNKFISYRINESGAWNDNELVIAESTNGGVGFKNNTTLLFNDPREADAYPNLSHNGLRLYYTKDNIIYFSERDNTSDKFKASHQVAFEEIEEFTVQSAWFSKNEKELFFVDENIIYYSKRKNRKKAFTTPVIYSEMFADADGIEFVTWISFCKRKKQLFVNISTDEKDYILFFQK